MKKILTLTAVLVVMAACGPGDAPSVSIGETGGLALTLEPSASENDEIVGFKVEIFKKPENTLLDSAYIQLINGHLPPGYVTNSGDAHDFASKLFVLPPGNYRLKISPMKSETLQSLVCQVVETDFIVIGGQTTTVVLMSNCIDENHGAAEVLATLNNSPQILDLTYNPSQFVQTCQNLGLTLTAQDPDGDALTYNWAMTQAPVAQNTNRSLNLSADSSHWLSANDSPSLSITGDMTIEARVKRTANEDVYIASKLAMYNYSFFFYIGHYDATHDRMFFEISNNGTTEDANMTKATSTTTNWDNLIGQWKRVAMVFEAGTATVRFYVDNVLEGTAYTVKNVGYMFDGNAPLLVNAYTNTVGAVPSLGNPLIDEVRIWNVARTGAQIAADSERQLQGNEAGLVGYWKFNSNLNDSTAHANNLSLLGGGSAAYSTDVPFVDPVFTGAGLNNTYSFVGYQPGNYSIQSTACDPFNVCSTIIAPIHVLGSSCLP